MRPSGAARSPPPFVWDRPLTSRPQVPQSHVDGEVAKLADLLERQGQP